MNPLYFFGTALVVAVWASLPIWKPDGDKPAFSKMVGVTISAWFSYLRWIAAITALQIAGMKTGNEIFSVLYSGSFALLWIHFHVSCASFFRNVISSKPALIALASSIATIASTLAWILSVKITDALAKGVQ